MAAYNFQIGQIYNFEVYPAAFFGTEFKAVEILAIMNYELASKESDPQAIHVQIAPFLPVGTPGPTAYNYVKVKTTAGNEVILGLAWINPDTIVLVQALTITCIISNTNTNDVPRLRNALIQNGFNTFTVSIN